LLGSGAASKTRNVLGQGQNHLAKAGGCGAAFFGVRLRRTHPLPRGGSDPVQVHCVFLGCA